MRYLPIILLVVLFLGCDSTPRQRPKYQVGSWVANVVSGEKGMVTYVNRNAPFTYQVFRKDGERVNWEEFMIEGSKMPAEDPITRLKVPFLDGVTASTASDPYSWQTYDDETGKPTGKWYKRDHKIGVFYGKGVSFPHSLVADIPQAE